MILTYLLFSMAPLLTSSLLPPLLFFGGASEPGFSSLTNSTNCPSSTPANAPLASIFRKLAGMTAFYFDSHCSSAEEYLSFSLSSATTLFTSLILNAAKSSIPFGCNKHQSTAWWSAEVKEAVSERSKAFTATHKSD